MQSGYHFQLIVFLEDSSRWEFFISDLQQQQENILSLPFLADADATEHVEMDFFTSGWLTQYCWRETYQACYLQLSNLSTTASSAKCLIRCASFPKSIGSFFFLMMWSCKKLFPRQCTHSLKHFFQSTLLCLKVWRQQLSHLYTSLPNSN